MGTPKRGPSPRAGTVCEEEHNRPARCEAARIYSKDHADGLEAGLAPPATDQVRQHSLAERLQFLHDLAHHAGCSTRLSWINGRNRLVHLRTIPAMAGE